MTVTGHRTCSFSRIRDVPSTLWLGFVYDVHCTSLRRLRRLCQHMPERQALTRNLLPVVPGAGRSVLVPARTAGLCQWQRTVTSCMYRSSSASTPVAVPLAAVILFLGEQLETLERWWNCLLLLDAGAFS